MVEWLVPCVELCTERCVELWLVDDVFFVELFAVDL